MVKSHSALCWPSYLSQPLTTSYANGKSHNVFRGYNYLTAASLQKCGCTFTINSSNYSKNNFSKLLFYHLIAQHVGLQHVDMI